MFKNLLLSAATMFAMAGVAYADPVDIRIGAGPSADEQLWLMKLRPDLTPNQGKIYNYKMTMFRGANERFVAYQAGQLDAGSTAMSAALFAASKDIPLTLVAAETYDESDFFSTDYLTLAESKFSKDNLKGATIGLSGFRTSFELYARVAVQKLGLNPERDVNWLIMPLGNIGMALRAGKIDLGVFPTFYSYVENKTGGVKTAFTAFSISGVREEFDVFFSPDFIAKNREVVRAWASDFRNVSNYLNQHQKEARQAIADSKIIEVDPAVYLQIIPPEIKNPTQNGIPQIETLRKLQDLTVSLGFQPKKVDVDKMIDASLIKP